MRLLAQHTCCSVPVLLAVKISYHSDVDVSLVSSWTFALDLAVTVSSAESL